MKKYVQVGCGARGVPAYSMPLTNEMKEFGTLCGVYDINHKRAETVEFYTGTKVPIFDDFDAMVAEVKPDTVIVTVPDCDHDYYVIRALEAGCDVIVEKPLTTTFEKANAIRDAEKRTGKKVTVTFNLRFHPFFVRLKELVSEGVVGKILSVHMEWLLNTSHGADYFRRWHSKREKSGSLLVHKSTHHFDIVNWLLEEKPLSVNAFGTRRFYGPTREERGERCLTCPYKKKCKFFFDILDEDYKRIYLDCEEEDGYIRDRCLFSEEIDIEDSASVNVKYSGGAVFSYSLTAHSPYEAMHLMLNGTEGRLEATLGCSDIDKFSMKSTQEVYLYNRHGEKIHYQMPQASTQGHGGADMALCEALFCGMESDPLHQMADTEAGMCSIGIGMAANISMAEGRQVQLSEFYEDLKEYENK